MSDIVYSPGEDVFLVVLLDGNVYLSGQGNIEVKMKFTQPQGGVSRVVWIDQVSGDFLTASPKAGVLRIYNAALPHHKEIIKVSKYGIKDLVRMSRDIYLIKLKNGQIIQYNVRTKKTLFTSDVAHTHQIQKTLVHPEDKYIISSVGYDGSLRLWNLRNMELESQFEDRKATEMDSVIQTIAWCKIPKRKNKDYSNLLAMGTRGGLVKLVDLHRNRVVSVFNI